MLSRIKPLRLRIYDLVAIFFGSPTLYCSCPELYLRSGQPWVFCPLAGWNDKQVELHNSRSGLQRLWECSQNKITLNCFSLAEVFSSRDELDYKLLLQSPPDSYSVGASAKKVNKPFSGRNPMKWKLDSIASGISTTFKPDFEWLKSNQLGSSVCWNHWLLRKPAIATILTKSMVAK